MAPSTPKPVNKTPWKKTKEMRPEAKERRMLKRIAKLEKETEAAKVQHNDEKTSETFPVIDRPTLSVAVPFSILENCQSGELKAYVAGKIARAASIYKVDEVIVFDDTGTCGPADVVLQLDPLGSGDLQFFLTNPLDTPHQLRKDEEFPFRYCGFTVRMAPSLSAVFTKPPANYTGGYDLCIGTSDKGQSVDDIIAGGGLPPYKHALLVVGGLEGLEGALEADSKLENVADPTLLFDYYLNTCPGQVTRTIRNEEAVLISLTVLKVMLNIKKG